MIGKPAGRIGRAPIYGAIFATLALVWSLAGRIPVPGTPPEPVPPPSRVVAVTEVSSGPGQAPSGVADAHVASTTDRVLPAAPADVREHRLDEIAALGSTPDPRSTDRLRALLDDPDVGIRETAVETLGLGGHADAIAGLGYALGDPEPAVRELTIEVLAELGTAEAAAVLALTLDDPDPGIRRLAAERLAALPGAAPRTVLQRFAADPEPSIRRLATSEPAEPR